MTDAERKTASDFKDLAREVAYRWCMAGGSRDHLKVSDVRSLADVFEHHMHLARQTAMDEVAGNLE